MTIRTVVGGYGGGSFGEKCGRKRPEGEGQRLMEGMEQDVNRRSKSLLQVESLTAGYGGRAVIRNVGFAMCPGEILALIGPNGAGKTTLIKAVGGLLQPMGGSVFLGGKEIGKMVPAERAGHVAMMLPKTAAEGQMTCVELVGLGRHPYTGRFGLLEAADRRAIAEALELVEMAAYGAKRFSTLSSGQQQRVLLARAIAQEPEVMLLDEPSSYLDMYHKLNFLQMIRRMTQERQMGVLLSVHEPELAWQVADRILCLSADGEIIHDGEASQVITDENLCRLYGLQPGSMAELYKGYSEVLTQ